MKLRLVIPLLVAAQLAATGARADAVKALKKLDRQGLEFTSAAFLIQVFLGHTKIVELYLEAGMSPDASDEKGETALHSAARMDSAETIAALLAAKARVDSRAVDGDTPLCLAAGAGRPTNVELLVAAGADVNAVCSFTNTPLHLTAGQGDTASLNRLLDAGARVEARERHGETPLIVAASRDSLANVLALLAAGADVGARSSGGNTALHEAVSRRQTEIVRTLLDASADPNAKHSAGRSPLDEARRFGTSDLVALLESAGPPAEPSATPTNRGEAIARLREAGIEYADEETLFQRVEARDVPTVKLLLAAGVPPSASNVLGRPPLWEAIRNEDIAMIEALIAGGADVDDPGEATNKRFESGQTLVMLAVDRKDPALLAALLAAGASPDKANVYGVNGLASSAMQGKAEHVRLLIEAGADVDTIDSAGTLALFSAVRGGNPEVLQMLLDAGARIGSHLELLADAASTEELRAMLTEAAASPRATATKPPPVRPPAPPAPKFTTPIALPFGVLPVTAAQVYDALLPIARVWQPDAELVDLGTTSQGLLAADGRSDHWVAHFYSRSAQKVNTMAVHDGSVVPSPSASNELRVFEVGPTTILDTARLYQIAEQAGANVLTERGVRPMIGLLKNPSTGVAWYFNYDDPDSGRNAMTIVIDAHSGKVVFKGPK
ncbi:MAG: ankyrin repeat domain-containing protein [Thermoanaerobaculia bacterium]